MTEITFLNKLKTWLASSTKIDQEIYNTYLANSEFIEVNHDEYWIVVKSVFGVRLVEPLIPIINEKIREINGSNVILSVITKAEYKTKKEIIKKENSNIKKSDFCFENFVTGPSNTQAFLAAQAVSKNPGQFSPLFIYGASGLGKTHLLKSICFEMTNNNPKMNVLYISSEEFGRKVIDVLQKGHVEIEEFKNEYINSDVLLIDDIQFLAKKEKTNEILFTIFNNFIESGKQLVFSSDKIPDELNGFDSRHITRFNLGLTVPIEYLDFSTALAILNAELKQNNLFKKIDDQAKDFIANFLANDVRKIKGVVTRLNFWMMTNPNVNIIDLSIINDLFKDTPTSNLGVLNVKKIKEVVGEKYNVSINAIDGKSRTSNIAHARHVAMYLTKNILNHNLAQIGAEFGGRDHTTVMSAITKIESNMTNDKEFKKIIEQLKTKILSK